MICIIDLVRLAMSLIDFNNLADLVFFQNGMLEPWLQNKGLDDADQVLAYFAVSKFGEPPVDGKTDTNPEGLTAAYGKWATAVAERLIAGGLSCKVNTNFYLMHYVFRTLELLGVIIQTLLCMNWKAPPLYPTEESFKTLYNANVVFGTKMCENEIFDILFYFVLQCMMLF